jgi:uncharacterized membrane protein
MQFVVAGEPVEFSEREVAMRSLRSFFSPADMKAILEAIQKAESRTSGEIMVRVERKAGKDPMAVARKAFDALGMRNTELHNGVLFLVAIADRRFVVLGDDGINEKVPQGFWNKVRDVVMEHFGKGAFGEGLAEGVRLDGEQLAIFFPHQAADANELPDAISYADER